jgi:hypothetical protein
MKTLIPRTCQVRTVISKKHGLITIFHLGYEEHHKQAVVCGKPAVTCVNYKKDRVYMCNQHYKQSRGGVFGKIELNE